MTATNTTPSPAPKRYPHTTLVKMLWLEYKQGEKFLADNGIAPIEDVTFGGKRYRSYDEAAFKKVKRLRAEYDARKAQEEDARKAASVDTTHRSTTNDKELMALIRELTHKLDALDSKVSVLTRELGGVTFIDYNGVEVAA